MSVKKWLLPIGIIVIVVIAVTALLGGSSSSSSKDQSSETKKELRFQDRADAQEKDLELLVNESGELEGMKVTVTKVERKAKLSEFEEAESGKEFVMATISLENVLEKTTPYNGFYFRIQTAGGQVLDQSFSSDEDSLGSGDLIAGGKHSGTVTFESPKETGHQYLIYKPSFEPD